MLKILYSFIISMMILSMASAGNAYDDISAIKETAMNYMESWYQGDADRMKSSLHDKLAKRSLKESSDGNQELRLTSASDMVLYTEMGYGKRLWKEAFTIDVIVLDHYQNIATVKVIAPHYLEYLHLVKKDHKWLIVNALYEKKQPESNWLE